MVTSCLRKEKRAEKWRGLRVLCCHGENTLTLNHFLGAAAARPGVPALQGACAADHFRSLCHCVTSPGSLGSSACQRPRPGQRCGASAPLYSHPHLPVGCGRCCPTPLYPAWAYRSKKRSRLHSNFVPCNWHRTTPTPNGPAALGCTSQHFSSVHPLMRRMHERHHASQHCHACWLTIACPDCSSVAGGLQ